MTREHKVALILGFALVLVVGIAISDHFSRARVAGVGGEPSPGVGGASTVAGEGLDVPLGGGNQNQKAQYSSRELVETEPRIVLPAAPVQPSARDIVMDPKVGVRAPQPGGESARIGPEPSKPVSKGRARQYVVKPGETLFKIASRTYESGHLWRELAAYNNGRVGSDGFVAQNVTIVLPPKDVLLGEAVLSPEMDRETPAGKRSPSSGSGERVVARAPPKKGASKPSTEFLTHEVQSGDQLAALIQRIYGPGSSKRLPEVLKLNKDVLADADTLVPGVTLKFPAR